MTSASLEVRASVVADKDVAWLVDDLPGWGELDDVPGHHSPKFLPNQLNLLADMGVRAGDFKRVDALLEGFLGHQDKDGRFESLGKAPGHPDPEWGSLLCDTNVITYLLMRYNLDDGEGVERAIQRIFKDVAKTPQGRAWQCIPQTTSRWRGSGPQGRRLSAGHARRAARALAHPRRRATGLGAGRRAHPARGLAPPRGRAPLLLWARLPVQEREVAQLLVRRAVDPRDASPLPRASGRDPTRATRTARRSPSWPPA